MILFFGSSSFAETSHAVECSKYISIPQNGYESFSRIYPKELFQTAIKNHSNYCCKYHSNIVPAQMKTECENNPTDNYVDSPWLFDHFVDVGFRYLDGIENLQYDNTPIDIKWAERREKIIELGTNPNGAIPLAILNDYKTYRWDRNKDMEVLQSQTQSCQDSIIRFQSYNQQRDSLPIAQKYFIICEMSSCMASNEKNTLLAGCQNVAIDRVVQEDAYVQSIVVYQGEQALNTNFSAYARSYVTHNRMTALLEKIVTMAKWLWFVDSKVPEMTRMCSA